MSKQVIIKKCLSVAAVTAVALSVTLGGPAIKSRALLPDETVVVFEGETVKVPAPSIPFKAKVKIADKKIARVKKKKKSVEVTGVKAGKTKMTVKMGKDRIVYKVKVYNKNEVQKKAGSKLDLKARSLGTINKYAMTDLNGDGITDMFADGDLYAYDYQNNDVVMVKTEIDASALDKLFISEKEHVLYMEAATGAAVMIKGDPNKKKDYYSGKFTGLFFEFDTYEYFDGDCGKGFIQYFHPELFVDKKDYVEGTDYYCYYDSSYDQDDYWYEWFTKEQIPERLQKLIPDAVEIPLTVFNAV